MQKISKYKRIFLVLSVLLLSAVILPARSALAQDAETPAATETDDGKKPAPLPPGKVDPHKIGYNGYATSSTDAFESILNLVYTWSSIVAVIVLIIAGYLFVTARGDPSQMKRSKDAIRGAVVGLVIVAIAFVITRFVIGGVQG